MNPKIIFREIKQGAMDIKKQRSLAHFLVSKLTGKKIKHSKTGRPIVDQSVDVSISHKNDLACAGVVPAPYRIGIDVEHIKNDINAELFLGSVITKTEVPFLKTFCENNNISISSGILPPQSFLLKPNWFMKMTFTFLLFALNSWTAV